MTTSKLKLFIFLLSIQVLNACGTYRMQGADKFIGVGEDCAPIRQGIYAPLNDWVLDQIMKPVKKKDLRFVGWHMSPCDKTRSMLDQRFLFQNELYNVALNGTNLCIDEPHIFIDASRIPPNQLYKALFTDQKKRLDNAHWMIGKLIKAQCLAIPPNIIIEIIAPKNTVKQLEVERNAKTREDWINVIKSRDSYGDGYATAYKGYFSYNRFRMKGKLFGDALKDDPTYAEVKQKTVAKNEAEIEKIRKIRQAQEDSFNRIIDPLVLLLQNSTYQFADETICFFLHNKKRSFSSNDYKKCHDALNDDIERAERDNPELKQLIELNSALGKIKKYVEVGQKNTLAPLIEVCIEDYISLKGSKRIGEKIDRLEAIKACAF